jgi:ribosomal protein L37AE/L43A
MRHDHSLSMSVRSCPICRVGMVRTDAGWHCPQCGSAIVGGQPEHQARALNVANRGVDSDRPENG